MEVIIPIIQLLIEIVSSNATPAAIDLIQQILLLYVEAKQVSQTLPIPKLFFDIMDELKRW